MMPQLLRADQPEVRYLLGPRAARVQLRAGGREVQVTAHLHDRGVLFRAQPVQPAPRSWVTVGPSELPPLRGTSRVPALLRAEGDRGGALRAALLVTPRPTPHGADGPAHLELRAASLTGRAELWARRVVGPYPGSVTPVVDEALSGIHWDQPGWTEVIEARRAGARTVLALRGLMRAALWAGRARNWTLSDQGYQALLLEATLDEFGTRLPQRAAI